MRWRGCDTSRCMPRRRSSRNSLTSRGRRFDSRLNVNAQQIICRRIVAAKYFARLREVARIAAGFEVAGFARIDPVLRRAGRKFRNGATAPKIPCSAREIPCSCVTGICAQAFKSAAGFPARICAKGDLSKNSLQIPVEQRMSDTTEQGDSEFTHEQAAHRRKQAPVMACYDFSKALVWLEIPRINRRAFFRAFAARLRRLGCTEIRRAEKPCSETSSV